MEGRKVQQLPHHIDLNERTSIQDPSENSMEQQENLDTDVIESGHAAAILNPNDNNSVQAESVPEGSNEANLVQAESVPEGSHEAKRGRRERVHWTEGEHKLFLEGIEKYGKGRWKDISKEFVVTKTPIQIASHAQKYFIHQNVKDIEKRKKRRSIHDTTLNKNGTLVTLAVEQDEIPSVEQQSETPPQGMQQTQTQQNEISPMLCLLFSIGSTIPDKEKLEKMRDLLAKELRR
ncbi:putative transcription factor MYB-HB-like family [Medicago truncatula]|uniref:Myb-like DNA-binding domain protein n=1 Tax=Medicago truncatula TaxID=3880 RepID=G7K885_MEDTR|nr:transcription factor SRM1 [Medicago truncatula]AES95625.1 myb-like DNA-binding domain protein [Medicago truncatula]RHN54713.1 putative transcription factor MYB-HB-like family [Medicago truncatula]